MPYEMIIGHGAQQPFTIPGSCSAVSHRHAMLRVDDMGNWYIDDLTGPQGNGTYIRDSEGIFRRITSKMIYRDSIIRLGSGGHNSFTFYANRIIAPDDYSYEFDLLHQQLMNFAQEQATLEAENEKKGKRMKYIRMGCGVLTAAFVLYSFISGNSVGFAPAAVSGALTAMLPAPDQKPLKQLMERKKTMLVCPKCFNPISEIAINNRVCPMCKAKG